MDTFHLGKATIVTRIEVFRFYKALVTLRTLRTRFFEQEYKRAGETSRLKK